MNFLFDESVDAPLGERLKQDSHSVECIWDLSPGISDDEVITRANRQGAILVTCDRDFGELVFRMGRVHNGVILIRLAGLTPEKKADVVSAAVREHGDKMPGAFTVITPGIVRVRRPI